MSEFFKHFLDGLAVGTALGALFKFLPAIASLFSIVWLGMQMYDWIQKKRNKHGDQRLNQLDS
jgi:glycerol-3-phosphate acyltransferase PlsY